MSRSRRKAWVIDGYGSGWKKSAKRCHNQIIRHKLKDPNYEISDGGAHKRGHGLNQWDICDYKWLLKKPYKDKTIYKRTQTLEEQQEEYDKICRK